MEEEKEALHSISRGLLQHTQRYYCCCISSPLTLARRRRPCKVVFLGLRTDASSSPIGAAVPREVWLILSQSGDCVARVALCWRESYRAIGCIGTEWIKKLRACASFRFFLSMEMGISFVAFAYLPEVYEVVERGLLSSDEVRVTNVGWGLEAVCWNGGMGASEGVVGPCVVHAACFIIIIIIAITIIQYCWCICIHSQNIWLLGYFKSRKYIV